MMAGIVPVKHESLSFFLYFKTFKSRAGIGNRPSAGLRQLFLKPSVVVISIYDCSASRVVVRVAHIVVIAIAKAVAQGDSDQSSLLARCWRATSSVLSNVGCVDKQRGIVQGQSGGGCRQQRGSSTAVS